MSRPPLIAGTLVHSCCRSNSGIQVGKETRRELIRRVRRGDVRYAQKLTASRTMIVLEHDGVEMAFVYSKTDKTILRFLQPNAPETVDWLRSRSCRGGCAASESRP